MTLTEAAMDELDRGRPWTSWQRSRVLGGHCVPLGAYDQDSFTCVTWGQTQSMSVEFYRRYFDEVVVPIDLDWMSANGTSPAGLDIATLNADYEALTGNPGPFPPALPTPAFEPAGRLRHPSRLPKGASRPRWWPRSKPGGPKRGL
jgi:hypothetical protein